MLLLSQLFSRNAHDETLPTSIQTMSCKLLLNLVECIRQRSEQVTIVKNTVKFSATLPSK